ncbi:MAG: DNA primase [Elusimicrobiota bacterium]|jgi:DNA primase|nr:DNA primase [Elusimicrobiota bacterium]
MKFSNDIIHKILQSIDIVDIIQDFVILKKTGSNFKGLCPFHNEKTPSFIVSQEKQIYHCFGCNEGGNAITFLMKMEHLTFVETIIELANKLGIKLENENNFSAYNNLSKKDDLHKINAKIGEYYHKFLLKSKNAEDARKYLKTRDVDDETIKIFMLGYADNNYNNIYSHAIKDRLDIDVLEKLSLIKKDQNTKYYDFFRNRIIFPIKNVKGQIIAFGGRVLDDSLPKYINSAETEIFKKNSSLYALDIALQHIKAENKILILEGYMDVITLYSNGIKNSVATLGTALGENHLNLIRRYTQNIILIFDGDDAGIKASIRSTDLFLNSALFVKIVLLPDKLDPDEFIKIYGTEKFLELINNAQDEIAYRIDILLKKYDISKFDEKEKFLISVFEMLILIENKFKLDYAIKKISDISKEKIENIVVEFKKFQTKNKKKYLIKGKKVLNNIDSYGALPITTNSIQIEQDLLGFLIKNPQNIEKANKIIPLEWIKSNNVKNILKFLFANKIEFSKLSTTDAIRKIYLEFLINNEELDDKALKDFFSKLILLKNIKDDITEFAEKLKQKFFKDKLEMLRHSNKIEDILELYKLSKQLKSRGAV